MIFAGRRSCTVRMLVLFCVLVLSACGKTPEKTLPDMDALVQCLKSECSYSEELKELPQEDLGYYMTVEPGVVARMYVSGGSSAEQFAVFCAPDEACASRQMEHVRAYLSDQGQAFADYLPEETRRIEDALLIQMEQYVVLCVSEDSEEAENQIRGLYK